MPSDLFVSYLRPVRSAQGGSERGLEPQRAAVARHLGRRGRLVAEVLGDDRPDLGEALGLCRRHGATLLVAELGTWGDDPAFLRDLNRDLRRLDLRFAALDRPEASERTLGIMAAVAEAEDRLGLRRTSETVARRREFYTRFTAERRGAPPPAGDASIPAAARPLAGSPGRGGTARERAEDVAPILGAIRAAGALTLEQVANALNALGIPSARGDRWYPMQVTRIEKRLAAPGRRRPAACQDSRGASGRPNRIGAGAAQRMPGTLV